MNSFYTTATVPGNSENNVFSEEFISASVIKFLKGNGYKVHKEKGVNHSGKADKVITASTFFKKEIIEIKGQEIAYGISASGSKANNTTIAQPKFTFTEAILNSLINLGNFYRDENVIVSMAIPNISRYKAIIERVHDYFTLNDLYFKIYLVNENGEVEVFNLNEHYSNA